MDSHSRAHKDKVKVTIECTADERAYIKMLAAKAHLNISELVLSYIRTDFPRKPNKETLQAHEEALSGGGVDCYSLEDFWQQMGVKFSALD
jgi:hypothetical protein